MVDPMAVAGHGERMVASPRADPLSPADPPDTRRGAALVTGAARRIGLAVAQHLARAGWDVALHASPRSAAEARAAAARITSEGARTCVVVGDLAEATTCATLVDEAAAALGPLRLLVNNAAIFEADGVDALDLALWDRQFAVNLRAPVLLAARFARQADALTRTGADVGIVNLVDQRVLRTTPRHFSYTLTKSALWTATRTMAQAFADRGVRVNAVGPGPVLPNADEGDDGFAREVDGVPLHRAVHPDEIAAAVLYLAEARGVTGQLIAVDAGQHLGWRTPDVVG